MVQHVNNILADLTDMHKWIYWNIVCTSPYSLYIIFT